MPIPDIERLLTLFYQAHVDFILIGGIVAVIHGATFVAYDVDIRYRHTHDNISRLCQAITPPCPQLRGALDDLPFRLDPPAVQSEE